MDAPARGPRRGLVPPGVAVVDRSGMRWSREDTRSYCSTAGYLKPPFESTLVDAEVLPARDGADVGTLVCYWRLER